MQTSTIIIEPTMLNKEIKHIKSELEPSIFRKICCIFTQNINLLCSTPIIVLSLNINSSNKTVDKKQKRKTFCRYGQVE